MLEIDLKEDVTILKMNHGKVNAMDIEFCRALTEQMERLARSDCSAVVLTSTTRVFSAGIDLRRLLSEPLDYVNEFLNEFDNCFKSLLSFPKPLVAAINGPAIAGGCVLAAVCDYRVIDSRAKIGTPELRVGVAFPPVALEIIRMVASPQAFHTMVSSGKTYRHQSAIAVGLADAVAGPVEVLNSAIEMALQMALVPSNVFQITKRQVRMPVRRNVEQAEQEFYPQIRESWNSPEIRNMIEEYVRERL